MNMTLKIANSISFATKNTYPPNSWYLDKSTNKNINIAVKQGWVFRPSVTQCEWTEKGIEAYKNMSKKTMEAVKQFLNK